MTRRLYLTAALVITATLAWKLLAATPVTVARATLGPAIEAVYATGTVEADPRVEVKTKVSGTVVAVLVKEGDRVRAGQLLARLENKSLRFELERTRAELRAADRRAGGTSPQLAALKAVRSAIEADVNLAASELVRAEALVKRGAMATDELDRRRERLNKLRADLVGADARIGSLDIDLHAERERIGAVAGSMAAQHADTEVRAPMDGTVTRKRVELGEAVVAGQLLFVVGHTDHLVLEVKIDEADIGRVRVGQEVLVDLHAFSDRVMNGRVTELMPDADRDTKTFLTKVELGAPPAGLRSGMSAEVNIVIERHEGVILVPAGAVKDGRVILVVDGRARLREVKTGLRDPRTVEIVSGVQAGDRVVLVGPQALVDGDRVAAVEGVVAERGKPSKHAMKIR